MFYVSKKTGGNIVSPFKSPQFSKEPQKISYTTIAVNLKQIQVAQKLPIILQEGVGKFHTAEELAFKYIREKAIFRKTCINKYDGHKLFWKIKDVGDTKDIPEAPCLSRRNVCAKNFTDKCFLCDITDNANVFHSCQTLCLACD